jgi:CAAX protease family protein
MDNPVDGVETDVFPGESAERRHMIGEKREAPPADRDVPGGDPPGRGVQMIELGFFLLLILPAMSTSFLISGESQIGFVTGALLSILSDLGQGSLVLYFVWRNREPLQRIGWTLPSPKEFLWGLVLYPPIMYGANGLVSLLHALGLSAPTQLPPFLITSGKAHVVLAVILVTVVAIVEETVFRGYLILRLKAVTGRTWLAVVLSAAVFSFGHGYEGSAGLISVFFLGIVLAVVYLWRGSLVASMTIHFLIDFGSIVLAALWKA